MPAVSFVFFFFSSRRRHTRWPRDWSSDVCSSDLSLSGPILTIRRFPKPYPIEELIRMGSLDPATGILLAAMEIGRASCRERVYLWGVAVGASENGIEHSTKARCAD